MVISPNEMNPHLRTVSVAPLTSRWRTYPARVPLIFLGTDGQVVLDQLSTVDKPRLSRRLGVLDEATAHGVLDVLGELFAV